jgi:CheY-like chemotaxis protein
MSIPLKPQVLVVDDESSIRSSIAMLLAAAGYVVNTAKNGFDALLQLKRTLPDLIISDLNMPEMSGFEFLSVVRRRFPQVPVLAMSGAYAQGDILPGGVIADGFYAKGRSKPQDLYDMASDLIRRSAERAKAHRKEPAPGVDSTQRKRFKRDTLHRAYLYGMPAVVSVERDRRRAPDHSGNIVHVLSVPGSLRHRFFASGKFSAQTSGKGSATSARPSCEL